MFVGCSEVSIGVIVKHAQNIGIIKAFCRTMGTQNIENIENLLQND